MHSLNSNWFLKAQLKTRQLLLLVALDDFRDIRRAAGELKITLHGASKHINELEGMLGVRLFDRVSRGMEPTLYGEALICHARKALTSLSLAHDDIAALKAGFSGQVQVGVIAAAATTLLPRAIARTKERSPHLRIGVDVESSNILLDQLQRGTLDFMIGRILENVDSARLIYEELTEESVCVVVRPSHPLLERREVTLTEISALPWIVPEQGTILRQRFDMMFRRAALAPPANVVESSAPPLVTSLLLQTDFLHVMSFDVASYYASQNVLNILPIDLPCKMDAFGIIRQMDHLLSPAAAMLLREVRIAALDMY